MKLGVKFGPDNWKAVLEKTQAKYAEIWFRLDWRDKYKEVFSYLNHHRISFGLHFWATLKAGFEPNLFFDRENIAQETEELIKQTIDIASQTGAFYINIHPGSFLLKKLNLDQRKAIVLEDKFIDKKTGLTSFKNRMVTLNNYASKKNILFLVENLPKNEASDWTARKGRMLIQRAQNIPLEMMLALPALGIHVTTDIGHLAASWETENREILWKNTFSYWRKMSSHTKVIHLNTVAPPFNGTDSHNGILPQDFGENVFPDKEQLLKFLSLVKERDDIWVIPEPLTELMADNYFEMKKLLHLA